MHKFIFYNNVTYFNTNRSAVMVRYFSVMFYYYHNILFALKSNKPKFNDKPKCHNLITNYELGITNYGGKPPGKKPRIKCTNPLWWQNTYRGAVTLL